MSEHEDKLAALLVRWEEAWDQGEDLLAQQLCADCPELADELQRRIDSLKQMAWVKESVTGSSAAPSEVGADEPGRKVPQSLAGRYRIEALIAQGGFGQVFRAYDSELQRHVAIKVPNQVAPERAESLFAEARKTAKLRHPGIVSVHDVGRDGDTVFIVSDLIDGTNLADRIATARPTPEEAARFVAEIADALHFAHEQGFIHRDIKPANILIDSHGRPFITDFGIAASKEDLAKTRAITAGTLPYMAPEQVAGEGQLIDARTDLYALGVVLYELLTGRLPYQARTPTALREQILFRSPLSVRAINPAITEAVESVCLRCLAKHPADRYSSAKELAEALERALKVVAAHRRNMWPIILGLVPVIVVVVIAWNPLNKPQFNRWSIETAVGEAGEVTIPVEDGALVFDGSARIVTPVERFCPVTMEAWICTENTSREMYVVGSDIPRRWGICIGISHGNIAVELIGRGWPRPLPKVTPGAWHHVAAVFGEKETVVFFDGKRVDAEPSTSVSGGTPFVIGNVGEQHMHLFFEGRMRSVRLSSGERYSQDFNSQEALTSDATTVILYNADSVKGDRVLDLSNHANHGKVQRLMLR